MEPAATAKTLGPDLSSVGSPIKTPAPKNYTKQAAGQGNKLVVESSIAASDEGGDDASAKIEAWTSKFVTRAGGLSTTAATTATSVAVVAPAAIHSVVPSNQRLPAVEPTSSAMAAGPVATVPNESTGETSRTAIATVAATPPRSLPLDVSAVEFVPPPTVTRRMPGGRAQWQSQPRPPQGSQADVLPADYVESPLTRARRVDAQNTWREAQLKTFLAAKADMAKTALGSLCSVRKGEQTRECTSVGQKGQAQTAQGRQVDQRPSVEVGEETRPRNPVPLSACQSLAGQEEAVGEASGPTLSAPKVMDTSYEPEYAFVAEEQPPPATNVALSDDLVFEYNPPGDSPAGSADAREPSARSLASATTVAASATTEQRSSDGTSAGGPLAETLAGLAPAGPTEAERRRRLKERNERAVEKKKLLLQKAQQIRSQTVANLSGKPKELPGRRTTATLATSKASGAGTGMSRPPTSSSASSSIALQKQAVLNSAIAQTKSTVEEGRHEKVPPTTPQKSEGIFKLPLPKVKTPGSAAKSSLGEHPPSDDTFAISAANTVKAASLSVKASTTTTTAPSPGLPQIIEYCLSRFRPSMLTFLCSSSEDEDELASRGLPSKENRPLWANTPEVSRSLLQQRSIRPEDIFGEVEPVKLEGTAIGKEGNSLLLILQISSREVAKSMRGEGLLQCGTREGGRDERAVV